MARPIVGPGVGLDLGELDPGLGASPDTIDMVIGEVKEGRVGTKPDEQYFRWLRQLIEWQQEIRDPQEFIQNLKVELYPEEVYIFTPKGKVVALPRGASPVDFAYSIHTEVGHSCVGMCRSWSRYSNSRFGLRIN